MFTAKLGELLDVADDIVIDGYEIEHVGDYGGLVLCDLGDDLEWFFDPGEQVQVDEFGVCTAVAVGNGADENHPVSMMFQMSRPITSEDLKVLAQRRCNETATQSDEV